MAISKNNLIMSQVSGHIGKQLVFKNYSGKTVVTKYPDMSGRKLSDKQRKYNDIMANANDEARTVIADDTLRAEAQVRLNVTSNKLYRALIKEFFANNKQD
jgi:hypothetical protein